MKAYTSKGFTRKLMF